MRAPFQEAERGQSSHIGKLACLPDCLGEKPHRPGIMPGVFYWLSNDVEAVAKAWVFQRKNQRGLWMHTIGQRQILKGWGLAACGKFHEKTGLFRSARESIKPYLLISVKVWGCRYRQTHAPTSTYIFI